MSTCPRHAALHTWLGTVRVVISDCGIAAVSFADAPAAPDRTGEGRPFEPKPLAANGEDLRLLAQIRAHIDSPWTALEAPLDLCGTAFQLEVWQALRRIPAGTTVTYADLARRMGAPSAARAVAGACAANALAIAIPCHRVVRSDGSLSGYRWGVERKKRLLARERAALGCPTMDAQARLF